MNLNNLHIIIVEPKHAGNIGSIARACKTMGISHIRLVNPINYHTKEARMLAWKSHDVLEKMTTYSSFTDAISDLHLVIGTINKLRDKQAPFHTANKLMPEITPLLEHHQVGLVFGREDKGLLTNEIQQCHWFSKIPNHSQHPSLNLSQAVMVYAYEAYQHQFNQLTNPHQTELNPNAYRWDLANHAQVDTLFQTLNDTWQYLPFTPRQHPDAFTQLFKRLLNRTKLENRDVRLLFKLCQLIQKGMKKDI